MLATMCTTSGVFQSSYKFKLDKITVNNVHLDIHHRLQVTYWRVMITNCVMEAILLASYQLDKATYRKEMGNTCVKISFKRKCAQWYNLTCIYPGRETPPWVADASPSRDRHLHLPAHTSCSQSQAWVVWDQEDHRDIFPASPCAATSRGSLEFSHQVQPTHLLHIRGNNAEPWKPKPWFCIDQQLKETKFIYRVSYIQPVVSSRSGYKYQLNKVNVSNVNFDIHTKLQVTYWHVMITNCAMEAIL